MSACDSGRQVGIAVGLESRHPPWETWEIVPSARMRVPGRCKAARGTPNAVGTPQSLASGGQGGDSLAGTAGGLVGRWV